MFLRKAGRQEDVQGAWVPPLSVTVQDMGITLVTPTSAVEKLLYQSFIIIKEEVIRALAKLGEESIAKVRDRSHDESWIDHTGNLRSSIGYSVFDYGRKQIESAFNIVLQGNDGPQAGRRLIEECAKEYAKCYALVVVAGMNYADRVESLENKDVLTSTELWAKAQIAQRLEQAKKAAIIRINNLTI